MPCLGKWWIRGFDVPVVCRWRTERRAEGMMSIVWLQDMKDCKPFYFCICSFYRFADSKQFCGDIFSRFFFYFCIFVKDSIWLGLASIQASITWKQTDSIQNLKKKIRITAYIHVHLFEHDSDVVRAVQILFSRHINYLFLFASV